MNCLYYRSHSFNPYENLAVEKYFFDTLPQDFFVFYLWRNARTVVIGRNQNAYCECKVENLKNEGGTLARRMTGGGAVYHDLGNLNFTFIFHTADYDARKNFFVIADALAGFGIETQLSGRNDILAEGKKFSGNAFLTTQNKTCHHGTLMVDVDVENMTKYLNVSPDKLVKHGVKSVSARVENLSKLCPKITVEALSDALVESVKKVFSPIKFVEAKIENTAELAKEFSKAEYLFGSDARFVSKASERFDWGKADVDFEILGDSLRVKAVYSDSLDTETFANFRKKLSQIKVYDINNFIPKNQIESDLLSLIKRHI